jgi:hypothetical protein
MIIPSPGLPCWRLLIDPDALAAALQWRYQGAWLTPWPEVPVPGRLLAVHSPGRLTWHYELTWRGALYLPRRHEIRHALWLMPGPLPETAGRACVALVRALAATCESRLAGSCP